MGKKLICTIASLNYFAKVKSLADSVQKFNAGTDFYVLVADRTNDVALKAKIEAIYSISKVFYLDDLQIDNIAELSFKYNLVEFNTALKPFFLDFLFQRFHFDSIVYMDPDVMLFNSLDRLFYLQNNQSIILTPHLLDYTSNSRQITDFLHYGVYNLGFISINQDKNGSNLLSWWKKKLLNCCYCDLDNALAYDQKWMDFAPAFFDSVYIIKDPGYNFAFWNMNERTLTKRQGVYYINMLYPLVFAHFSHFVPQYKNEIAHVQDLQLRYIIKKTPALYEIVDLYYDTLIKNDYDYYSKLPYGFSTFDNGEPIRQAHRKLYGEMLRANRKIDDPFDTSCKDCFYDQSRKVFLDL